MSKIQHYITASAVPNAVDIHSEVPIHWDGHKLIWTDPHLTKTRTEFLANFPAARLPHFATSEVFVVDTEGNGRLRPNEACSECGCLRVGDDRVNHGLKCYSCAYGDERMAEAIGRQEETDGV